MQDKYFLKCISHLLNHSTPSFGIAGNLRYAMANYILLHMGWNMFQPLFSSLLALTLVGCAHKDIEPYSPAAILSKYGYSVHVPPSSLHGPGNLVWKRKMSHPVENQVILGDICSPKYILFPDNLSTSTAENIDFTRNKTFSFTAGALEKLGLSLSSKYLSNVTLSFKNTEVQEYSLEDLQSIRNSLGPACTELLRKQKEARNAYQVMGALKADMEYKLTYKTGVSADVARLIRKELSAEFGIDFEGQQGQVGTSLFYGLYLDTI